MLCACSSRGCSGCGHESLAVLVEMTGVVQRDRAAQPGRFAAAETGAEFESGDGLRTLPSAHARLTLHSAGSVLVKSDTTIRLWRGGKRGLRLKVQTGEASVVAAHIPLDVETEMGVAVLQPGSELRVRPLRIGQRYEVKMGRAILTTPDGQQVTLAAGEGIGVDNVSAEPVGTAVSNTPAADAGSGSEPVALIRGTRPSDLNLEAGSSVAIFDPMPPTAVGIDPGSVCPAGALLSVSGRDPIKLVDRTTLLLPTGLHEYRVSCLDSDGQPGSTQLRGSVRVLRNPGTAQPPRSAPKNTIEVDGRTYTIMFQNLLPVLEVRWPQAPEAPRYVLSVQLGTGRALEVVVAKPVHVFGAGSLPEGRHTLRFEAQRAGAPHSKITTVELRFDNAAPTASVRVPSAAGFEPGKSVHVSGIALPGSQVSVLGQRFTLDAQQRFAGDVALPPGTRSLAVRIQHPRTGARYYIRRARSAP
jgi:hypothetical protein